MFEGTLDFKNEAGLNGVVHDHAYLRHFEVKRQGQFRLAIVVWRKRRLDEFAGKNVFHVWSDFATSNHVR